MNKNNTLFSQTANIAYYLKRGGNPNIMEGEHSLISWMLKNLVSESREQGIKNINALMCHPDTQTHTPEIQGLIMKEWIGIRDYKLSSKHCNDHRDTFINKFDLNNQILTSRDGYGFPDYPTSWLNYFLCSGNTFSLFLDAHQYHPHFENSLLLKNKDGLVPISTFAYYRVQNIISESRIYQADKILNILVTTCPEALFEKNRLELDALGTAKKFCHLYNQKEPSEQVTNFIQKLEKYHLHYRLQDNLPTKSVLQTKVKI